MKFKFKFRYVLVILVLALVAGGAWFYVWAQDAMGPEKEALVALEAGENVIVTVEEDAIVFTPVDVEPETGLIFYPGGRVDYRSYARPLRQIASRGFMVISVRAPLNLMVFDPNRADQIIAQYPNIEHWAIGGHSLGGAMAAQYAGNHTDKIEGLVLWASYPANNNDLSDSGLQALSAYGKLDMAGTEPFEKSRDRMPPDTLWLVIDNGNHSQFGDYGLQPGDTERAMKDFHQQALVVAGTVELLDMLGK